MKRDKLGRRRAQHGNAFVRYWTWDKILSRVRAWFKKYGEAPRASDWDPTHLRNRAEYHELRAKEWRERIRIFEEGDWPPRRTCDTHFGSWNNMIFKAGFVPRAPGQALSRPDPEPSSLLIPIGRAMGEVYEAEDSGDTKRLIASLRRLEAEARKIRTRLEKKIAGL